MKAIAYLLMLAGFGWGLIIATSESTSPGSAAPVAALLGAGFGLLTIHSGRIGSIRGHGRRISRDHLRSPDASTIGTERGLRRASLHVTVHGPG